MDVLFSDLVDRMRLAGSFNYDSELAKDLEITPQALSNFKRKGKLPSDLAIRFALKHKVTVDWLLTGEWDQKSALVILRERVMRVITSRGIGWFTMDMPLGNQDIRDFLGGTFLPAPDVLLLLSKRAGGVCSDPTFLQALLGAVATITSPGTDPHHGDIENKDWSKALESTVAELKGVFDRFEDLVKKGKNPILHMTQEELEIIADREVWERVKQVDAVLQKKMAAQRPPIAQNHITQTVSGTGHKVAGRDIVEDGKGRKK